MKRKDKIDGHGTGVNVSRIVSVVYLIIILLVSVLETPSTGSMHAIPFGDKIAHFVMYAIMGILFVRSLEPASRCRIRNMIFVVIVCSLCGGLLEVVQGVLTITREPSFGDAMANLLGAAAGAFPAGGYEGDRAHIV